MSLDLTKIATQASNMVVRLKEGRAERQQRLQYARQIFGDETVDLEKLKRKVAASRTTWLVAELCDGLAERYPAPTTPAEFNVLAADGSHIDVDRHRSTRCYLINIGTVALRYGDEPDALLDSAPHLYAEDEDLVIKPAAASGREQMVEGTLLGIKRAVEECRHLSALAAEQPPGSSTLALLDGTLILWGLEAFPDFVTEALLDNGFLPCLEEMRKQNQDKKMALASYISFPRSTDVVNVLRVAICPHEVADCDRFCPLSKGRDCEGVAGVTDRELFMDVLEPGERSALFISPSKITKERYGEHRVYFFYIRLEEEVARVELPRWAAENAALLDMAHALLLDQCRRGQGYPVALSEAHEQAVVTGADRAEFWQLVESLCIEEKIPTLTSAKSFSKRTRWV
ncbi:MAG: DNA double-strand break repair nuclease NurA [Dehalococcoidia bacterium]|nr:DNA double-strand break repair nuclease NurA [Dehalococcoidia bacterium]